MINTELHTIKGIGCTSFRLKLDIFQTTCINMFFTGMLAAFCD
jgi:hypothetical protein